jgi:hypothetical protein
MENTVKATEILDKWDVPYHLNKNGYITEVWLPLTFVEWGHLCMRDGEYYLGGCCGNLSSAQDILNAVFRDSGMIKSYLFRALVDLTLGHEGFGDLKDESLRELESLEKFEGEHPFRKIAAVWQVVKNELAADYSNDYPHENPITEEHQAAFDLSNNLSTISWGRFFGDDKCDAQRSRSRTVARAKVLASMKTLYAFLQGKEEPLPGYGIRSRETKECARNGFGLCLYESREKAQETLDLWARGAEYRDATDVSQWEIVPCVVTLEEGLKWEE